MHVRDAKRQVESYRQLLRQEARIGGGVFGPVPQGRRREFVCLDEHTWLWHEEWQDVEGRLRSVTTRYDVHKRGITKSQNGRQETISAEEALNLLQAARNYQERLRRHLYQG